MPTDTSTSTPDAGKADDKAPDTGAPPAGTTGQPGQPSTDPAGKAETDWKAEARKWEKQAKENAPAAKRLAELETAQQTETERLVKERDAAATKATQAVQRAVKAEVRSTAASLKFRDPADAMRLLDLEDLTDPDGDVDEDAVRDALEKIAKAKPYLLDTAPPPRSGGQVGGGTTAGQLTRADLKGMTPHAIEKARKEGRLDAVLGGART